MEKEKWKFDAPAQVPINVTMENPWTWIIRFEPGYEQKKNHEQKNPPADVTFWWQAATEKEETYLIVVKSDFELPVETTSR